MSDFEKLVLSKVCKKPFYPLTLYDPHDDTVEVIVSSENYKMFCYKMLRAPKSITIYLGRESGNVVGCLISNASEFIVKIEQKDKFRIYDFFLVLKEKLQPKSTLRISIDKLHGAIKQDLEIEA